MFVCKRFLHNFTAVPQLLVLLLLGLPLLAVLPAMAMRPGDLRTEFVTPSATQALQWDEARRSVTLAQGQALVVQLETPINTHQNQIGDPIEASLVNDVYLYETKLFPRLTRFYGKIEYLDIPLAGRNPIIRLSFHHYQLPNGVIQPMQGVVRSQRADHLWGGELTPGTQPRIVRHGVWGIGYYNQVMMTGQRQKGSPLFFEPGDMLTVLLEAPLPLPHVTTWVKRSPHSAWPN
jgi:hypothetical protein